MHAYSHNSGNCHQCLQGAHAQCTEIQIRRFFGLSVSAVLFLRLEMKDDFSARMIERSGSIQSSSDDGQDQQASHTLKPVCPLDGPAARNVHWGYR